MRQRSSAVNGFFDQADALRAVYEARQRQPYRADDNRFVWDYFHVPAQYTYMRTPAKRFFPPELFGSFVERLTDWGRRELGCPFIHTCWLSFYVDGCEQQLHSDVQHGPWAFSYSLTRWNERGFNGGETLLLADGVLDYWRSGCSRHLKSGRAGEHRAGLVDAWPPLFNQLLVFDGRVPHAVTRVSGTQCPLDSRVVLHGWFAMPPLFTEGALSREHALRVVKEAYPALARTLGEFAEADGAVIVRLRVGIDGRVESSLVLSDTMETSANDPDERGALVAAIRAHLEGLCFGSLEGAASVTVPVAAQR